MAGTRCRTTAQFEIFLKVKQAHNPDFAFLDSKDELHPFYQWIKNGDDNDNDCSNGGSSTMDGQTKTKACDIAVGEGGNKPAEAMGVLAMYASSSSDDDDDGEDGNGMNAVGKEQLAQQCGTKIAVMHTSISNGRNYVEKVENFGTADDDKSMQNSENGVLDDDAVISSKHISSHSSECFRNSTSASLSLEQRKAERLKRAKLLRHHFANK